MVMAKRLTDMVLATTGLILLAPLFAIVAAALWLDDRGPMLHHGLRIGRGGRSFHILKFRTMRIGGDVGSAITVAGDPRVTRVGRVLRATKLDELPQLINVVRGDMSLVGPRPEAPVYVALYTPEQLGVLAVRPGITGPTQIRFRHEEHLLRGQDPEEYYRTVIMPAKLAIDGEYVRQASYWRDLQLLALTVLAVIRPAHTSQLPIGPSLTLEEDMRMRSQSLVLSDGGSSKQAAMSEPGGGTA